jgi:septum site-determining protein MinC
MALVLAPEAPVEDWLRALDTEMSRTASYFEGRPVVVDLSALPREQPDVPGLIQALQSRRIRIIGTEGAHPSWEGIDEWGRPPMTMTSRPARSVEVAEAALEQARAEQEPTSLLVDQPVRSGQSIVFERGDVIVLGSVSSGAEIIAGGSIHVYGALRGRAIAGLTGQAQSRIFCRKLEAELIAIDGVYRTAEDMDGVRGKAVQAWLEGESLSVAVLD